MSNNPGVERAKILERAKNFTRTNPEYLKREQEKLVRAKLERAKNLKFTISPAVQCSPVYLMMSEDCEEDSEYQEFYDAIPDIAIIKYPVIGIPGLIATIVALEWWQVDTIEQFLYDAMMRTRTCEKHELDEIAEYASTNVHNVFLIKYVVLMNNNIAGAAAFGYVDCIKYMLKLDNGAANTKVLCETAAAAGQLACVKYFYFNYQALQYKSLVVAVKNGKVNVVKFCMETIKMTILPETIVESIKYGQVECMKYFHDRGHVFTVNSLVTSMAAHSIEPLKYLISIQSIELTADVMHSAIRRDSVDRLRILHDAGGELTPTLFDNAVQWCSRNIPRYMLDNGCEWTHQTILTAVGRQSTAMLIHEKTVWADVMDCVILHRPQHIQFVIKNGGVVLDRHIYEIIQHGGRTSALQVIVNEYGNDPALYPADMIVRILRGGNTCLLKLVLEAKFAMPDDASIYAVREYSAESLKLLIRYGHPLHENTVAHAQYISYRCAIYAHENGVYHPPEEMQKIKDDLEYGNRFRVEGRPMQKVEHGPFDCSVLFN